MAKALFGHVGTSDLRLLAEVRRLQSRVNELRAEVCRLQEENAALVASSAVDAELLTLDTPVREPALA